MKPTISNCTINMDDVYFELTRHYTLAELQYMPRPVVSYRAKRRNAARIARREVNRAAR